MSESAHHNNILFVKQRNSLRFSFTVPSYIDHYDAKLRTYLYFKRLNVFHDRPTFYCCFDSIYLSRFHNNKDWTS